MKKMTMSSPGSATVAIWYPVGKAVADYVTIGKEANVKVGGSWGPWDEIMTVMKMWTELRTGSAAVRSFLHRKRDAVSATAGETGSALLLRHCKARNRGCVPSVTYPTLRVGGGVEVV